MMTDPAPSATTTVDPAAATPPAAPVPTPPPAGTPPVTPVVPVVTPTLVTDDPATWPEQARRQIEALRKEAGDQRINAKKQAATDALKAAAELAGIELPPELIGEGGQVTPDKLAQQVATVTGEREAARQDATRATRDRDLVLEAWKAGVAPSKVDYLRFLAGQNDTYKNLDPSSAEYGATLTSTVAAIVAADQALRVTGSTAASGAEGYGGAGDPQAVTQEQFDGWSLDKRQALYESDRAAYDRLTGRS